MKIYFIQSTPYYQGTQLVKKSRLYFVGLAPAILSALCPKDDVLEACFETIEEVDFETDAELIAISGMGHGIVRSIDIAKAFKKKNKTVVMGGYMVSLMPEEAKKYCDSVIIGDAELSFPLMLGHYKKGVDYKKFLLLDDNIIADRDYMLSLCRAIKPLKMKWLSQCSIDIADDQELLMAAAASGCIGLSFGIESITQESLNIMNKQWAKVERYGEQINKIQAAGIDVSTEMVIGADGDTLESIQRTADFIVENRIAVPRFYILTPIPGTQFFNEMEAAGRIRVTDIYSYNGTMAVHEPMHMTMAQFTDSYWRLYKEVFTVRNIIKRTLLTKGFLWHPLKSLFYFYVNMFYRYQIRRGITPNIV